MGKVLVAYFSASGVTKRAAQRLAQTAGADLFEIKPSVPYTSADLDWTDKSSRSSKENADAQARPEIAEALSNADDYDVVFIGFPIWWYVAPKIINTFLESYNFSGKTLIPFATSGGSGMGRTVEALSKICPSAEWKSGFMLNRTSDRELKNTVDKIFEV